EGIAIGNPLGQGQKMVKAIIGDTKQVSWDGVRGTLQTLAAKIQVGNSGGGTFDLESGELLGIVVAKSTAKDNEGYMVPVKQLMAILRDQRKLPTDVLAQADEIDSALGVKL